MPDAKAQSEGIDFAECEKEHHENQRWHTGAKTMKYGITYCTDYHRNNQSIAVKYTAKIHNLYFYKY